MFLEDARAQGSSSVVGPKVQSVGAVTRVVFFLFEETWEAPLPSERGWLKRLGRHHTLGRARLKRFGRPRTLGMGCLKRLVRPKAVG